MRFAALLPAPSNLRGWFLGFGLAFASLVVLVAASFAWVAVYSHVLRPGEEFAVYQAHAKVSAPWVAILGGIPLFYWIGVRLGLKRGAGRPVALWTWLCYLLVSVLLTVASGVSLGARDLLFWVLSHGTKLAMVLWGCARGAAREGADTEP